MVVEMWGHPLEHGQPASGHTLKKKNGSPLSGSYQLSVAPQQRVVPFKCPHLCWKFGLLDR